MLPPFKLLHRYWVKFRLQRGDPERPYLRFGIGVTASDVEDALSLVQEHLFPGQRLPEIADIVEVVDLSTLDPHARPNIDPLFPFRGVWFPPRIGRTRDG